MNASRMRIGGRSRPVRLSAAVLSAAVTLVAVAVVVRTVDQALLGRAFDHAVDDPGSVAGAVGAFAGAFALRVVAWRRVLPGLGFGHGLAAVHVALGANHVLPLRLGEPLRVVSVTRRAGIGVEAATASTVTLRAADVLALVALGAVVAPAVFVALVGVAGWILLAVVAGAAVVGWRWLVAIAADPRGGREVALPGVAVLALATAAWMAEAIVTWQAARWAGLDLTATEAILITTVAVAAQIAAIAPGGFGTYEAAAVAAYVALGFAAEPALVAALGAHALKTAYSLVAGAVALVMPAPGLLGRFRLAPVAGVPRLGSDRPAPDRPIVLFMPAHDEEASVGACVARVPDQVLGRPVEVVVVDDGSTDATSAVARAAGADVVSLERNRGLGAAVRVGLAEGVARQASVVVFCDADGEYPPEELSSLVAPILAGEADYVTGSRFLGRIDHMRAHRRVGNVVLTALLSFVARRRITDGQTGYRAFSPEAAREAEIIHDFNYAQVLTLDLVAKGFRFTEVPISYRFRTEGESFIRPYRYLRAVAPAVYRQVNRFHERTTTDVPTATA